MKSSHSEVVGEGSGPLEEGVVAPKINEPRSQPPTNQPSDQSGTLIRNVTVIPHTQRSAERSEDSSGGAASSFASLPCSRVADIPPRQLTNRWLIDKLWSANGVGILGGTPKTGKTWLALDMAVSVASGTPAMQRFAVAEPGPVLIFAAEDDPSSLRERIEGICRHRNVDLQTLPLHVITSAALRLDEDGDRFGLERLLTTLRPKLLILDPLVRLHGGDENYAGHIARLLGYLRGLQRRFELAVLVTHHVSKRAGNQPGNSLRGSSDLHAWGDSNIYLRRDKEGVLTMALEHRSAESRGPFVLSLVSQEGEAHFEVLDDGEVADVLPALPLGERVQQELRAHGAPLAQWKLRKRLRVRNQILTDTLRALERDGKVRRESRSEGWEIAKAPLPAVGVNGTTVPRGGVDAGTEQRERLYSEANGAPPGAAAEDRPQSGESSSGGAPPTSTRWGTGL